MTWLLVPDLIAILTLGVALGFFGGLFGIGGGLIAVPMFVLAFGMDQASAQGTALVLMVPNLIAGWLKYQRKHTMAWQPILILAGTATFTTYLMAKVALLLDPLLLQVIFNLFLFALGLRMWIETRTGQAAVTSPILAYRRLPVVGFVGGSSMGLLGMGGGLVATPLLSLWLKQSQTVSQSLSLALVMPCSVVALSTYANAGRVDWALGLPMAAGGLATVSVGVAVAHYLPENTLRRLFAGLLMLTGAGLTLHGLSPLKA